MSDILLPNDLFVPISGSCTPIAVFDSPIVSADFFLIHLLRRLVADNDRCVVFLVRRTVDHLTQISRKLPLPIQHLIQSESLLFIDLPCYADLEASEAFEQISSKVQQFSKDHSTNILFDDLSLIANLFSMPFAVQLVQRWFSCTERATMCIFSSQDESASPLSSWFASRSGCSIVRVSPLQTGSSTDVDGVVSFCPFLETRLIDLSGHHGIRSTSALLESAFSTDR